MKLEIVHNKLCGAITTAERISKRQSNMPILSCVLFETTGKNSLTVRSTNLDLGLEIVLTAKIEDGGSCAVPAGVISSFLSNLPDHNRTIKIYTEANTFVIESGSAKGNIKTVPIDDFPIIPKPISKNKFSIQGMDFVRGLKSVWYSSSVSSVKPELASIYVNCDGEFVLFAATDSFRLAEKRLQMKKSADFDGILIPFASVPEIMRILDGTGAVEVNLDKNQISFSFDGVYMVSRIIDGIFPDYKQIIPRSFSTEAVVLKQDLLDSMKLAHVFSDKFNQIHISIDPSAKKMILSTKNSDIGENSIGIDGAISGDKIDINFNYKYINDCFQSIDSDSVSLQFGGTNKPLLITPISEKSFRYIVMPMNR